MNNPNVIVPKPAADLGQLAARINAEHVAAAVALKAGVERARACGELLAEAKKLCPHGGWLPWLEKNCPGIGARQVQKYMRLARNWDRLNLPSNANPGSHSPINAALAELSAEGEATDNPTASAVMDEARKVLAPELAGLVALLKLQDQLDNPGRRLLATLCRDLAARMRASAARLDSLPG